MTDRCGWPGHRDLSAAERAKFGCDIPLKTEKVEPMPEHYDAEPGRRWNVADGWHDYGRKCACGNDWPCIEADPVPDDPNRTLDEFDARRGGPDEITVIIQWDPFTITPAEAKELYLKLGKVLLDV